MPKKKDEIKNRYRAILVSGGNDFGFGDTCELEECLACDCESLRVIRLSLIPDVLRSKFEDGGYSAVRLYYDKDSSSIRMCNVVYLCKLEEDDDVKPDSFTIEIEGTQIIL